MVFLDVSDQAKSVPSQNLDISFLGDLLRIGIPWDENHHLFNPPFKGGMVFYVTFFHFLYPRVTKFKLDRIWSLDLIDSAPRKPLLLEDSLPAKKSQKNLPAENGRHRFDPLTVRR